MAWPSEQPPTPPAPFENPEPPTVQLSGENGNVFNLTALCSIALRRAGQEALAAQMRQEIFASQSYEEALAIMARYCDVW